MLLVVPLLVGYMYLYFTGCKWRVCRAIGVYKLTISSLPEYCEYLRGENLSERYGASVFGFDCEALRNEFVKNQNGMLLSDAEKFSLKPPVSDMLTSLQMLGVWREGRVLHIANPLAVDAGPPQLSLFSDWKRGVYALATRHYDRSGPDFCVARSLQPCLSRWSLGAEGRPSEPCF